MVNNEITIKLTVDGKEANATLSLTDEQLKQIARQASKAGTDTTSSLSKIGMVVTGLNQGLELAKKGIDLLAKPVTLAMDAEQVQTSFEVMLGSAEAAKNMISDLKEDAVKTPYEFSDYQKATQVLLNFGIAADQVRPLLSMLGDVSAGDAEKLQQLALVMGQVSSAGKLQGQDLMQLINAGFNPLQEISRTTGKSMADLRKEMEGGKISYAMVEGAFKTATSEGGRFNDMMDKQSQTGKGLQSTLEDVGAQVLTSMGEKMLPTIKHLQTAAIEFASSMVPVKTKADEATESGQRLSQRFETLAFTVERLGSKTNRTKEEQKLYQDALDNLQKEYPNYFKGLDTHNSKYSDQVTAINKARVELNKYIDGMVQAALVQDKTNEIIENARKRMKATESNLGIEKDYNEANANKTLDTVPHNAGAAMSGVKTYGAGFTVRQLLNMRKAENEAIIKAANDSDNELKQQIERLIKNRTSFIAPSGTSDAPGGDTTTSTTSESKKTGKEDAFVKNKAKTLGEIIRLNEQSLEKERAYNMDYISLLDAKAIKQEELSSINAKIQATNDQKELDSLNTQRTAAEDSIKILDEEIKNKEDLNSKEMDAWRSQRDKEFEGEQKHLEEMQKLREDYYESVKFLDADYMSFRIQKIDEQYQADLQAGLTEDQANLSRKESLKQLENDYYDWKWQKYQEDHKLFSAALSSMWAGYDTFFRTLLDKGMTGKERLNAVWESIKEAFVGTLSEMAKQYLQQLISRAIIGKGFEAAAIASAVGTGTAIAAAYAPAAAFASIMTLGGAAIAGSAGLSATTALAYGLAIPKFAEGGLVAGGEKIVRVNEEGEEYIVNADATRKNLQILKAMNAGANLAEIAGRPIATEALSRISMPVLPYSISSGGSGDGFKALGDRIENGLKSLGDRMESVERYISVSEVDEKLTNYQAKQLRVGN